MSYSSTGCAVKSWTLSNLISEFLAWDICKGPMTGHSVCSVADSAISKINY